MGFISRYIAVWILSAGLYQVCVGHPISGEPDDLSEVLKMGTRVVRGPDWKWGDQDGNPPGEGSIDSELSGGWTYVQWDTGHRNHYKMGADGQYGLKLVEDARIRLMDGDDKLSGQVEINHDGIWGTVCDVNWDIQDAMVVCRQLGNFLEAVEIKTGLFYGER